MVTALEPSATVAIIARNEERSIGAAIQSVNDQGVNGVSVLVVDDSSTTLQLRLHEDWGPA